MAFGYRFIAGLLLAVASVAVLAAGDSSQPSAPYLRVAGTEKVERLPLLMTSVDARIAGVIADVGVTQVYENRGDKPIEAVYVFPGSTRAAVYAVTMTIGERVIKAQIQEREKARATYESAKASGRTASLLEQQEAGIFQMNVANVLPGDKIKVEMHYTELLVPTEGQYEFFFPNTFTERYVGVGQTDVSTPTSAEPEVVEYSFNATVRLASALPISEIASPSHKVDVARPAANEATVALSQTEARAAQKDFVLHYRLGGDAIETGLLLSPGPDANYFALIAQPPLRAASAPIVPREFIFVVDVSGSMHGKPLELAQSLMTDLLGTLNMADRFNIVMFSGGSKVMSPQGSVVVTNDTARGADEFMHSGYGGGGTELIEALKVAYAIPPSPPRARTLVVITDGEIASGGTEFKLVRSHLAEANVFAFGIGEGVNHPVIENLARGGMGEPFIVDDLVQGPAQAARLRAYIDRPLFSHVQAKFVGFEAFDVEPQVIPDLMAERPLVLVGKYQGSASGTIELSGLAGGKPVTFVVDAAKAAKVQDNGAVRYLWARSRIGRLLDENITGRWSGYTVNDDAKHEITDLGLRYSLLTPYTSFVAYTAESRTDQTGERVQQPAAARSGSSGGWGSPLSVARKLDLNLAERPAAPALPPPSALREVAGKHFALRSGRWEDVDTTAVRTTLRVRVDSAAFAQLVALSAGFAEWAKLGNVVMIKFGDLAIELSPDGFSDFPALAFVRVQDAIRRAH